MKKQLLILAGILIVVFFSSRLAATAKIDTSVSVDDTYRSKTGENSSANKVTFLSAAATHVNSANTIFSGGFNPDKRSKSGLLKTLMSVTTIPLFISPGNYKKTAFLTLANEKVLLGSPSHSRFSYPAIAFRVKF